MCTLTKGIMKEAPSAVWWPNVVTVGQAAQQIAGQDTHRRSVTVFVDADATAAVRLLPDPNAVGSYVRVKPGAGVTINTIAPVYALAEDATEPTVYVLTETGCVGLD